MEGHPYSARTSATPCRAAGAALLGAKMAVMTNERRLRPRQCGCARWSLRCEDQRRAGPAAHPGDCRGLSGYLSVIIEFHSHPSRYSARHIACVTHKHTAQYAREDVRQIISTTGLVVRTLLLPCTQWQCQSLSSSTVVELSSLKITVRMCLAGLRSVPMPPTVAWVKGIWI